MLFIHERHRERERERERETGRDTGRDTGRGRSRLHAGSLMWDLILGLQDHAPSRNIKQTKKNELRKPLKINKIRLANILLKHMLNCFFTEILNIH